MSASNTNKEKHCLWFQKTGSINKRRDVDYCHSKGTKSLETSYPGFKPSSATYCVTTASYLTSVPHFFECLKQ